MKYKVLSFRMALDLCNYFECEIDELAEDYGLTDNYIKAFRKYYNDYMGV